jgi:hypothetical protein
MTVAPTVDLSVLTDDTLEHVADRAPAYDASLGPHQPLRIGRYRRAWLTVVTVSGVLERPSGSYHVGASVPPRASAACR